MYFRRKSLATILEIVRSLLLCGLYCAWLMDLQYMDGAQACGVSGTVFSKCVIIIACENIILSFSKNLS